MRKLLNPDVETFIIGGLGCNDATMRRVGRQLSEEINDVHCFTYSEASKMGHQILKMAKGKQLAGNSGGGSLLKGLLQEYPHDLPDIFTLTSPPNELTKWRAAVGFTRTVRAVLARSHEGVMRDSSTSPLDMIQSFVKETGMHPVEYSKLIRDACRFKQLASAVELHGMGIRQVNLIVPRDDELFSSYKLPMNHDEDDSDGVLYATIDGGHHRFSEQPLAVFREAELAPYAMITEQTLSVDIPERLSMLPTLSESASTAIQGLQRFAVQRVARVAA